MVVVECLHAAPPEGTQIPFGNDKKRAGSNLLKADVSGMPGSGKDAREIRTACSLVLTTSTYDLSTYNLKLCNPELYGIGAAWGLCTAEAVALTVLTATVAA